MSVSCQSAVVNGFQTPSKARKEDRHFLCRSGSFKQKIPQDRLKFVRDHLLCQNCLNHRHPTKECPKLARCIFCNGSRSEMENGRKCFGVSCIEQHGCNEKESDEEEDNWDEEQKNSEFELMCV